MIAAYALMLLADAADACPTAAAPRLGGGAAVVREEGAVAAAPFARLGPTTSVVTKPATIQQTGAAGPAQPTHDAGSAEQCAPVAFPIA